MTAGNSGLLLTKDYAIDKIISPTRGYILTAARPFSMADYPWGLSLGPMPSSPTPPYADWMPIPLGLPFNPLLKFDGDTVYTYTESMGGGASYSGTQIFIGDTFHGSGLPGTVGGLGSYISAVASFVIGSACFNFYQDSAPWTSAQVGAAKAGVQTGRLALTRETITGGWSTDPAHPSNQSLYKFTTGGVDWYYYQVGGNDTTPGTAALSLGGIYFDGTNWKIAPLIASVAGSALGPDAQAVIDASGYAKVWLDNRSEYAGFVDYLIPGGPTLSVPPGASAREAMIGLFQATQIGFFQMDYTTPFNPYGLNGFFPVGTVTGQNYSYDVPTLGPIVAPFTDVWPMDAHDLISAQPAPRWDR